MENYGIKNFTTLGIEGKIKEKPEDFIVEEILDDKKVCEIGHSLKEKIKDFFPKERKEQVHFTLVKKNWTVHRAISKISNQVRVSRKRFGFAGTKDKKAITSQRMSVWNVKIEDLKKVNLKDLFLKNFEYSNKRLSLGDLYGNRFTITIRNAKNVDKLKNAEKLFEAGIKNYFGPQRFGTLRCVNKEIGKKIILGHFQDAVKIFITETGDSYTKEREFAKDNWEDWDKILKQWPKKLGPEAAILNYLLKYPTDYANAFRKLHKNLRRMFVHSFQSYIFNRVLSEMEKTPERIPLVGYKTNLEGACGDLIKKILDEENIKLEDFEISRMPELASKGMERDSMLYPENFKILKKKSNLLKIQFTLKKGAYATNVLMKMGVER